MVAGWICLGIAVADACIGMIILVLLARVGRQKGVPLSSLGPDLGCLALGMFAGTLLLAGIGGWLLLSRSAQP